ncbi:MAG: GLPGLI family protein [Chitinophagaceae bacterium]|nr:MAG: GLPGLI family protein [Chitinophagaceae bacterium]
MKIMNLIALLCCFAFYAHPQNTEKITKDKVNLRFYYTLAKKKPLDSSPYRIDTMLLDIGTEVSRFYDPARLTRDSAISSLFNPANSANIKAMNVFKGESAKQVMDMPGSVGSNTTEGESYQILKDKKGNVTVLDYVSNMSPKLRFEENLTKLNWQLEEETDTIASYTCQRATLKFRGRNYIAWFTTDIPVNDGPWKFSGLPGLILKIEDADQLYSFTLIGMIQPSKPIPMVIEKSDYLKITREDYNKQLEKKSMGVYVNYTNGVVNIAEIPGKLQLIAMELE